MNAIGWEGIYVMFPEFTFNKVLVRQDAQIKKRGDQCMPKYFARGWLEILWEGKRLGLEEVEGLTARRWFLSHVLDSFVKSWICVGYQRKRSSLDGTSANLWCSCRSQPQRELFLVSRVRTD